MERGARLAGRQEDMAQMFVDLLTGGWAPRANGTSLSLLNMHLNPLGALRGLNPTTEAGPLVWGKPGTGGTAGSGEHSGLPPVTSNFCNWPCGWESPGPLKQLKWDVSHAAQ